MSRQGRILVADDLERWREELSGTLRRGGFYVDTVATSADVRERLAENLYHLLVLDIRMEESDQSNVEGMQMLHDLDDQGFSAAMAIIMLSAHGKKEQMREAFRQYKVTDFIDKHGFDNLEFLEQVRRVFAEDVRINLNLTIHWQDVSGPEQVVLGMKIGDMRIKRKTPLQDRIAAELDDLLCRLFPQADSILIRPLVPGHSGAGVLWAQPFSAAGGGRAVVVKFGDFQMIEDEAHNFKTYIQPFVGGGRSTSILDLRRTPRLGGIVYSLMGADQLEDFGSFYQRSDISQIRAVLDDLFLNTCGAWYANTGRLQPCDLTASYQQALDFTHENLEQALIDNRKLAQGKQMLHFSALSGDRTFKNPVYATAGRQLVRSTYICTTHGDFNEQNILVDNTGHTWLIDFQGAGPSHILRDVAKLDSVVRFQLLAAEEATLEERLKMEELLCSVERFSQVERLAVQFPTENRALAKAYATAVYLRILAHRLIAQNPSDDMSEYTIALLYNAMNTLRFFSLDTVQREHALLCACLLAERLKL